MSRKVEALRDAKLGLARTAVVDLIRKAKVEGRHDLTARAMRATTPAQFQRVVDSLAAKIAKADAKKAAADAAAAKAKAAAAAEKEAKSTESLMAKNERAALAATISNEMERWGPQSKLSAAIFGDAQDRDKKLRRMVLKLFTYGHMKPWTAAIYLFGEGKGREVFYDNLNAAANRRLGDYQADTDYLKAAIEAAGFKLGSIELAAQSGMLADAYGLALSRPGDLFHVKPIEHTVKASHKITYGDDRVLTEAEDIGMTSDERMEIQGLLWHKQSRDLILGGTPITLKRSKRTVILTPQNVADLESTIPQWERNLTLAVWERYNGSLGARLNAWSKDALGEDLAEGNYWPRVARAGAQGRDRGMESFQSGADGADSGKDRRQEQADRGWRNVRVLPQPLVASVGPDASGAPGARGAAGALRHQGARPRSWATRTAWPTSARCWTA
jgi:hypothetical protein